MSTCPLGVALVLAAVVLAGCSGGGTAQPAPATPVPTRTVPPATLSTGTTLVTKLPRMLRMVDGYHMYEVSPEQYETIRHHVGPVLVRSGLLNRGVRFGANYEPDKHLHFVLIDPGPSGLSARQILDQLLGII